MQNIDALPMGTTLQTSFLRKVRMQGPPAPRKRKVQK